MHAKIVEHHRARDPRAVRRDRILEIEHERVGVRGFGLGELAFAVARHEQERAERHDAGRLRISADRLQKATSSARWLKHRWSNTTIPESGRERLSRFSATVVSARSVSPINTGCAKRVSAMPRLAMVVPRVVSPTDTPIIRPSVKMLLTMRWPNSVPLANSASRWSGCGLCVSAQKIRLSVSVIVRVMACLNTWPGSNSSKYSPDILFPLLDHRLRDLEADQPRDQNCHVELAEHRFHHRETTRALRHRRDIAETSRREAYEAVVDQAVERREQGRDSRGRPLEKLCAEGAGMSQFDSGEGVCKRDSGQQVGADGGADSVEGDAGDDEQARDQGDDGYCQEQAGGNRREHFYREVSGKPQRYAASNRGYDQHQRDDEIDAQCAEGIKGGEQHQ